MSGNPSKKAVYAFLILAAAAIAVRLIASQLNAAYDNDVLTFQIWASDLFSHGLSNFYTSDSFTDYPPVYMYVLYAVGMIRSLFNLAYSSPVYNLLIRIPAIFCDMAIGYIVYIMALSKTASPTSDDHAQNPVNLDDGIRLSLLFSASFLFNPAIILDSAVWGQVDSFYTLWLFISLYALYYKKHTLAYLFYGLAVMTKPQSLIIGPVYLYSAFICLREQHYTGRAIGRLCRNIVLSIALMFVLMLPFTQHFDLTPVFKQYVDTLDSYAYGSVNAYNFFSLIGGNWKPLTTLFLGIPYYVWGGAGIFLAVVAGLFALYVDDRKQNQGNLYLIAAAVNIFVFMFSVKMHERYLYPSLVLLLAAYINRPDKHILRLYAAFSVTFFINCAEILRMLKNGNQLSVIQMSLPVISFINLLLTVYMIYTVVNAIYKTYSPTLATDSFTSKVKHLISRKSETGSHLSAETYTPPPAMGRMDIGLLLSLMLIYGVIAFIRLGNTQSPQTTWTPKAGELAIIDLGNVTDLSRFQFMMGARHDKSFMFYASKDGQNWDFDQAIMEADVFAWTDIPLNIQARYIEIIPFGDGLMLQEIALRGADGQLLPISNISPEANALIDEPSLVPETTSFMNSTYFDEIYHARTGYEFVHGLTVYENTHPPLGKDLIALSITLFGMVPFAWRLPGTLFGLLMIPLIYALARQMYRSNNWAFFAAFIFTFDFMHFVQTRIATIDTYVTFFIIAMYLFMYMYIQGVAVRTRFHSLGFLCLSGVCMGLAIASKWQGVYGAVGLPLLFFPTWYGLFKRNKKEAGITLAACVVFFLMLPTLIYCLSYIPFIIASDGGIRTIIDNQRHMFWYHSTLVSEHAFSSHWWEWPLMLRPIYYYSGEISKTLRQGISSFGNPAVWWFGIFALGYAGYSLYKRYDYKLVFLLVAYAAQFLPWLLVSRTTYIYHYFPSVPFVVLLITYFFVKLTATSDGKRVKWAYGYATLTALLFALFYPVLSGMTFPVSIVHTFLRWLPGWVLM